MRESQLTGRLRLRHLLEHTEAVAAEMAEQRPRFQRLARDESAPRVVSSFNLFQTPEPLARRIAALLLERMPEGGRLLEPSAGLGRLYRAARAAWHAGPAMLVDESADCCRELYHATSGDTAATLRQGDFLNYSAADLGGEFDGVLMNPPFKMGRDVKHIRHARAMLKPGGRLVSICANGPKQRAAFAAEASQWIDLEPGAFKESGTNVAAAIVVFDAPV